MIELVRFDQKFTAVDLRTKERGKTKKQADRFAGTRERLISSLLITSAAFSNLYPGSVSLIGNFVLFCPYRANLSA